MISGFLDMSPAPKTNYSILLRHKNTSKNQETPWIILNNIMSINLKLPDLFLKLLEKARTEEPRRSV